MATSGSIDFTRNRDQIIADAYAIAEITESGETPTADMVADASVSLNLMGKTWQKEFGNIWKQHEAVLFLVKSQNEYDLGAGSADHAALLSDAVKTELSTAGVATDTTIEVDSITGIANADQIGIVLDDDTMHWTTVNGAPSGTTVTLTVALPSAAAVDNHVYAYTTLLDRPMQIRKARRRDPTDRDIPVHTISRQEYWDLPNKTTEAKVVQVYYQPVRSTGTLWVWPTPDTTDSRLIFTARLPIEDFDAATDDPDFPQEWLEPLAWGLALRLAPIYGLPLDRRNWIKEQYAALKSAIRRFDSEPESIYFQVDDRFRH